jgi:ATP-dependent Clp protease protease subunit
MTRTVVEERPKNLVVMDVFSKLVQERIIFIGEPIYDEVANGVIAQMLYLDSLSQDPINIYINTPGGSVLSGLAIYDVSKLIKSPIKTVGFGQVCSMGVILLLMGSKRLATKNTRIMLHQVSGGLYGTSSDLESSYNELNVLKKAVYDIILQNTSLTNLDELFRADRWFGVEECIKNGILTDSL